MNNIIQINEYEWDQRFYQRDKGDGTVEYLPSCTHVISKGSPTPWPLLEWYADKGMKRCMEIMEDAGNLGSWVHNAIEIIVKGGKVASDEARQAFNSRDCLKALQCLQGFLDWYHEVNPQIIDCEYITWDSENRIAGTVDLKCRIDGEVWLVDFKTSRSIKKDHKVQLAAYGMSEKVSNLGLLHLGNTTKKGWSFVQVKEPRKYFDLYVAYRNTYELENPNAKPRTGTFPTYFKLK